MTPHKIAQFFAMMALTLCFTVLPVNSSPRVTRSKQIQVKSDRLVEDFSFVIKDLKVDHQGDNILSITVRYRYRANMTVKDYPDFRLIAKDIETFLTNYPHETDYWEIVNKKLTASILEKYSTLVSVTSQIEVSPTPTIPYLRSSITTRRRIAQGRSTIGR